MSINQSKGASQTFSDKENKSNIVYIVLDDVGFSDFGCFGSEIETPYIDSLSTQGLRYNNFNVTPLCSPTRASLLTGRNHHSIGMGHLSAIDLGPDHPNKRGRITPAAATTAEVLKDNGYSTFAVGKWHLAPLHENSSAGPFKNWPLGKGFERFYGFLGGATDQYSPDLVYDNHRIDSPRREDYHLSEDLVDHAIQFMTDHESVTPEKPFFLYLAFGAQHAPHQVPKSYIEKYKGNYDKGWDIIREERFIRQKDLGIIPNSTELAPRNPGVQPWNSLTGNEKEVFTRFQETYSGFLTHTDEQIGRFLNFLDFLGKREDTMIVLLSDNGASQEGGYNGSMNLSTYYNRIEESIDDMLDSIEEMGGPKADCNYPKGWAQVSNTPFKHYKQNTYFGGIHVPLIIQWPKRIQNKGAICKQFCHAIDLTPTVFDVLDIHVPETHNGVVQIPIHGASLIETFDNPNAPTKRDTQYFEIFGHRAIWHNGWMGVTYHNKGEPFDQDKWELYHVDKDFSQTNDLAQQYPEKLHEMEQMWWDEARKHDVLPLDDRTLELASVANTRAVNNRNMFVYYPGMAHIGSFAAPPVMNRSYEITVPVDMKNSGDEGVLVAHGNHSSGYVFYVKNKLLVYEYNYFGTYFRLKSEIEVPLGKSVLSFRFKKTGVNAGIGMLYINDVKAGEIEMPKTIPYRISFEGLDVGRDGLSPISPSYHKKGDFSFTGKIEKVVFDLQND
ncbi:arylsulfatase [Sporosarcina obsidiansis]|uniref:arylsulfatase n=1 Tax=Sporosarcina obsidiansis TaxID=2660748 RepID=UPI001E3A21DC|nr:arylsulfatase [Sporosarcina obsidiansis]